jgi:hypothetical protein
LDQRHRDVLRGLKRALGLAALFVAAPAAAAGREPARLYPTAVETTPGQLTPASASSDARTQRLGLELDETVREGIEDLGLAPLAAPALPLPSDTALASIAESGWVFAPRLSLRGDTVHVRLVAIAPHSRVELVREEELRVDLLSTLDVRTVVMLRDLFEAGRGKSPRAARAPTASRFDSPSAPPSSGRSVLALNAAVLGGYVGFTIQKASGSTDTRLVYPLAALGTGLGLGASLLVADEWDITSGDAWFLAAGMWWPAASGFLLAEGYSREKKTDEDRYLFGLVGAGTGLVLGTAAIAVRQVSEGSAVLAHSGGAFGALLGAMTDAAIQGETGGSVRRGVGWGTAAGVLVGGAIATQVDISPSRALLLDLSASLGTLGGAALASPLLLVNESNPPRTRLWLASAALGTVAGGVIGWYATAGGPGSRTAPTKPTGLRLVPFAGVTPSGRGPSIGVFGAF